MDKKKLIGTIIGVTMFAALIVGATYAWLSFNATITNGNVIGQTLNYWVNYAKGSDLSDIPILVTATNETAAVVTVTAQKPTGSIAEDINIYLTTTSTNDLTTSGAIKYAFCEGECSADFSGAKTGTVTAAGTLKLHDDSLTITSTTTTYYIYFWVDAAIITNDHLSESYTGYIHADSAQDETKYG